MKIMILSDLLTMRNILLQLIGISVVVGCVLCYTMESVVSGMSAIAAMMPFIYLFSLAATDEQNGWERFRLSLPISRQQIVFGRYAGMLLIAVSATLFAIALGFAIGAVAEVVANGQPDTTWVALSLAENSPFVLLAGPCLSLLVILIGTVVALPLIARFGITRATRLAPLVAVFAFAIGIGFFSDNIPLVGLFSDVDTWIAIGAYDKIALMFGGVTVAVLALYIASAFLASKLYERREF